MNGNDDKALDGLQRARGARCLTAGSGTVRAVGRVTSLGRRVAFAEATLHDGAGRLCATATLLVFDVES